MNMDEMITDYLKRCKFNHYTVDMIKKDIAEGISVVVDDGFMVMQTFDNELHVIHAYVKPSNKTLFQDFVNFAYLTAKKFDCKAVLFVTRRPKSMGKVLSPHGYKPYAVMFAKPI